MKLVSAQEMISLIILVIDTQHDSTAGLELCIVMVILFGLFIRSGIFLKFVVEEEW